MLKAQQHPFIAQYSEPADSRRIDTALIHVIRKMLNRKVAAICLTGVVFVMLTICVAAQQTGTPPADALYKQQSAPIELRIADLLKRMTVEEKVRQLDLYSGATALVDKHSDDTHATPDAVFVPEKAEALWGGVGVGGIHDLYPTPVQSNAIQKWVIAHNRLGIPAIFIEEALHGFNTGTVFPAPINLAATWNPKVAEETGAA